MTTRMPAAMMAAARDDPALFAQLVLQEGQAEYRPLARLHRELHRHLDEHPRALVELPRDHGKTTQMCLRVLWELGHHSELRVKLFCISEAVALDRSRYLRRMLRNPVVQELFPGLRPGYPWTATGFSVQRRPGVIGPSVAALGIGACALGTRADLLVCDDIVDVKAVYSAAERNRVADAFFNNLLNLLEPDGRFWGLCTPWHSDDLNARLKRSGSFRVFRRAVGADLTPVWRERWSKGRLRARRAEIGAAAFARGYLLTPIADEELLIRPEWVQFADEVPESFDRVILSVDPAVSGKASADASGLVVLGQRENTIFVLTAIAKRVAAPGLVKAIAELDERWQPEAIVFESNGAFAAVKDLLVRHASFGPKIAGVTQSKAKAARVAALSVSVQNGCVRLTERNELYGEMTTFPFSEHDDLVDALATGVGNLLGSQRQPRAWTFSLPSPPTGERGRG